MPIPATPSRAARLALALLAIGAGIAALAQQPAAAQTAAVAVAATSAAALPPRVPPLVPVYPADPELLQAFGGADGLKRLADDFVDRMKADARLGHFFEKTKLSELKKQLADHLCQLLAGPCVYEGDSMKAAHADLNITKADSLAQVEVLQASMNALSIPFRDQNRLLARLAPMYRDIITR